MRYLLIFVTCCGLLCAQSNIEEDSVHFIGQASAFTVGANLVTNGDFAADSGWSGAAEWTTAGGDLDCDGNQAGDSDVVSDTAITTVTGQVYRVTFTVTVYTAGNVVALIDGVEVGGDKAAVGTYTTYVAATDTSTTVGFTGDVGYIGSIDNVAMVAWVGDFDAGGGTTIADFTGTLTDYMGSNGEVLDNDNDLDIVNNGSDEVRIDKGAPWSTLPKVGTLVNIDFSVALDSGQDDGIYVITAVAAETIDIDADFADGLDGAIKVEVWIGGAYPDIATAINDSTLSLGPNGVYRKRYICVNVDQEVDAVTDFVAETSETALREDDGSRKIIAFNDSISVVQPDAGYRVVSDIDEGGLYYGGAWQAFKSDQSFTDVRPNGKWIEWNAKGNDINILELNTSNFELRNFKVHNTIADATAEGLVHIDTANFNTSFTNCWFSDSSLFIVDDLVGTGNAVIDCYFDETLDVVDMVDFPSTSLVNCIVNLGAKTNGVANANGCTFISSLVYKGTIGLNLPINCTVVNGIFAEQTTDCVLMDANGQRLNAFYNTIFTPLAAADNAIDMTNGSLGPGFNNIFYSVSAGAVLTVPIKHDQIAPDPPLPVGSIEKDPQFVNPAVGDYRLRASSPALNGGLRSLFDGYTTAGANQPYSSPNAGYRSRINFKGHNYSDR